MRRGIIAASLLLVGMLTACSENAVVAPELRESVTVEYDSETVDRGDVVRLNSYDAYVCATLEDAYFGKDFGTLDELYVNIGDRVKAGDVLATLDRSAYDAQIERARSALDERNERLNADIRKAEINVELARLDLSDARAAGDRFAIQLAELEVSRLENELTQVKELGELEVGKLRDDIAEAEAALDGTELVAPCDGEVVAVFAGTKGTRVTSRTPILRIADGSRMLIQYDGSENISNTTLSSKRAVAMVDGAEYELEPVIYEPSEYARLVLSGAKPPVQFTFAGEPAAEVAPGDFAEVIIYDSEARGVLRVPINALYTYSGGAYVYTIENGEKVYTEVEVGVRSNSYAEIVSGLEEGDVVFVKQ